MEKYGVVLAGGGAKGVYQIGAWRALRELDIPIGRVVGTSVGAMNGALMALDDYDGAVGIWKSMSIERGFRLPEPLRVPDKLFSLKNADILLRALWKEHGLDISPLRRRLEERIDENALRRSRTDFGLVTVEVPRRKSYYLYKNQIPQGRLMDYIMASAAYPGLKRPEIDGKSFIDGGLADNVPVRMLRRRQKDHIIVVNIGDSPLPKDLDPGLDLYDIHPVDSLGKAFEFQPETAESKMEMGWYDTMKAFGRFSGEWMYFPAAEYERLTREFGVQTVSGLEHAARLYGLDKLRVCTAEMFIRELLQCDRVSSDKFNAFRSHIDPGVLLRVFYHKGADELHLTNDILLQIAQRLLEAGKERPHLRSVAQRLAPGILRAAQSMVILRRKTGRTA